MGESCWPLIGICILPSQIGPLQPSILIASEGSFVAICPYSSKPPVGILLLQQFITVFLLATYSTLFKDSGKQHHFIAFTYRGAENWWSLVSWHSADLVALWSGSGSALGAGSCL